MLPRWIEQLQRGTLLATAFLFSAGYASVGLVILLFAVILEGVATRRVPWRPSPLDIPLFAFAGAFLIIGLLSPYRLTALGAAVLSALTMYVAFGPLFRLLKKDGRFLESFLWAWAAGAWLTAVWVIVFREVTGQFVATPALLRSSLGTTLLVGLVLGLGIFLKQGSPNRYLVALGCSLSLIALALTYSRGAWVGAVAAVALLTRLTRLRAARSVLAIVAVAGVAGVLIATSEGLPTLQRAATVFSLSANRDRIALARSAIAMFRDHPVFGTGLDTFSRVNSQYMNPDYPDTYTRAFAHNIFLNMAAEGGLIGLVTFGWVTVAALAAGLRWYRSATDPWDRTISATFLAALGGLLVHQQFDGTILAVNVAAGFWFLVAILAAFVPQAVPRLPSTAPAPAPPGGSSSILIVSNGHGEDAVGMAVAGELRPQVQAAAFPLVGTGRAYLDVRMLDPRRPMPSGGFALRGFWGHIWADLRAGMIAHWRAQRDTLRQQRGRHRLVVAIGDVYCLQMAALVGAPIVFVATAKSEHNEPHRWLERLLIRRHAKVVFTRDQATADALVRAGLPAVYVGNPLMDTIGVTGAPVSPDGVGRTVTILPGSRADAYANLRQLLQLCAAVAARVPAHFLCALAPGIDPERVRADAELAGWQASDDVLRRDGVAVRLTRAFGDAVQAADVVVGLAGTANEQAAGLGKPVVTFAGPGAQVTQRFVDLQKRLLGEALVTTSGWGEAADAVVHLLQDSAERAARGRAGRQRMGEPGAVGRIAESVLALLQEDGTPSPSPPPLKRREGGRER